MWRLCVFLSGLIVASASLAAKAPVRDGLKDYFFGESLYRAYQGDFFGAISRMDTELAQHYGLDEPSLGSLHYHIDQAEFSVGDFELRYRMHRRAGRAIKAVLEGHVEPLVRNEAAYRLARIHFQKDQPRDALTALERIKGPVPESIRNDIEFLRANVYMAVGRFSDAAKILRGLEGARGFEGFSAYNLGIAELRNNHTQEGYAALARAGQISASDTAMFAIRDKANLVLGSRLLEAKQPAQAKQYLDRVRLKGPFSNEALLASGWADANQQQFDRALVPWTHLVTRNVTDRAVQEALLAVPYAYGQLKVYGKAALGYGRALEAFGQELAKLNASAKSIREGKFLEVLVREEIRHDPNWVIKLRDMPDSPETYYLMELMASHDFQSSLRNYLDLEDLRKNFETWAANIDAWEEVIGQRRAYYQPLLPEIDREFRVLDSKMRLRVEQRDHLDKRIKAMLVAPQPDFLATAGERILRAEIDAIEQRARGNGGSIDPAIQERINRLRGVLQWRIHTEYGARLTEAYKHLQQLDAVIAALKKQYAAFVRTRQAASQSFEGYDQLIGRLRTRIRDAQENAKMLMARQGNLLERMALNELERRITRLEEYQVKARFAMADSYDRAVKAQEQAETGTQ
jgi:hypothetical protein